jgi:hypothetical protein
MAMTLRKARAGGAFLSFPAKLRDIWSRRANLAGNVRYRGGGARRLAEIASKRGE